MCKKTLIIIIFLFLCIPFYSEDFIYQQIELDEQYQMDKKIKENYGNLWIGYKFADITFFKYGEQCKPIEILEIYYKDNEELIFLGKINNLGIYDKDNELLCKNLLLKERFSDCKPLGLMEEVLYDPFYTGQYYLRNATSFGALEPYATISIDFENNTLKLDHLSE